jgi:hypothetical protein
VAKKIKKQIKKKQHQTIYDNIRSRLYMAIPLYSSHRKILRYWEVNIVTWRKGVKIMK